MNKDTKEMIGFPACMLLVIFSAYAFIKLIKNLPSSSTDEGILGGMLLIGFIGVPIFFGLIIAIVGLCMWMSTTDKPRCPRCTSVDTERRHHHGSFAAPECHYTECEQCGHKWDHT